MCDSSDRAGVVCTDGDKGGEKEGDKGGKKGPKASSSGRILIMSSIWPSYIDFRVCNCRLTEGVQLKLGIFDIYALAWMK